jgi:hypothetical protein
MAECERCGVPSPADPRAAADGGITLQKTSEGILCLVCVDVLQERGETTRSVDQAGLEESVDEEVR